MMTDGVLDALPTEREEETMKEIIMDVREKEPGRWDGEYWKGSWDTVIIMPGMI